ncbi:hypothetical protein pqer_cds_364 [Pandoravirus quercus]|uniref:Uncharacterized protein n=2 Tax=Pandoravirus TaxID=2060084 RepID=A0A2U7U8M9_9VIRU|nr:hypothetical protein pqer_cds_364 [Pandoravirus quercus]AVK74786.1 hypothetical protein pqer_cds_364 [Pandoravirus quercus]QBZ80962.1 hypothetical protein pclt_cds_365 [Pandoravirus celtis]
MAHRSAHPPRDIEMTQLTDRNSTAWDRPIDHNDSDSDGALADDSAMEMADVRRCATPERMCVPRLTRRWALAWATLSALAVAALVFGPWFGDRLAPQYALVDRVQRWPCTVVNHTVLATWWGHGNAMWQVPGVGVHLLRGDGSEADAVAWPRLLWYQSWLEAAVVAPYLALYPIGATAACYEDRKTHTVALRDDIDDLGSELVACLATTLLTGALAFWGVYKLLGPRSIP